MEIKLNQLRFYSYHGLHAEEALLGGEYEVNVRLQFSPNGMIKEIGETIDYSKVYERVRQLMQQPHTLLETLALRMADDILNSDHRIEFIEVNIIKCNPPIEKFLGNVSVVYAQNRPK